jgi:hypothetical protein
MGKGGRDSLAGSPEVKSEVGRGEWGMGKRLAFCRLPDPYCPRLSYTSSRHFGPV